jgi:hypothetical protein
MPGLLRCVGEELQYAHAKLGTVSTTAGRAPQHDDANLTITIELEECREAGNTAVNALSSRAGATTDAGPCPNCRTRNRLRSSTVVYSAPTRFISENSRAWKRSRALSRESVA